MSSTQNAAERVTFDDYPTPPWCTKRVLEALAPTIREWALASRPINHRLSILEPFAGDGAIVREVRDAFPIAMIEGWELQRGKGRTLRDAGATMVIDGRDSLRVGLEWPDRDLVISNPPFVHALAGVQRALASSPWVVMLLAEGWLAGGRDDVFRNNMPDAYHLPERPSFIASLKCKGVRKGKTWSNACGWACKQSPSAPKPDVCPSCGGGVHRTASDSNEYAWYVWTPERGRTRSEHVMLPSTPLAERKVSPAVEASP